MIARTVLALLAAALPVTMVSAQDEQQRPKVGLVLSGGGARGAAHVGVLRVLEELRIPVDFIAGNSMGALVGGVYAYGYSPQEMEDLLVSLDWDLILTDAVPRADKSFRRKEEDRDFLIRFRVGIRDFQFKLPKGLAQGHAIGNLLRFLLVDSYRFETFDELPIPFRAVATEIATGDQIVLSDGSLPVALSASMAIPGVFAPVMVDGRELVDGLVVNNIPIDVARAMGADVVIAIDIGSPLLDAEEITSLVAVTQQMLSILTQDNVDLQIETLTDQDVYLRPDLGDISSSSFKRVGEAIGIGERAARAMADELRRFSVSEAEYARFLRRQRRPPEDPPLVDEIRVVNNSRLADRVIEGRIRTRAGEPFDARSLQRDIDTLYGLEEFERVTFALSEDDDGKTRLDVIADEKSWGPNYLRFGLSLIDDFDSNAFYQLSVNHTMQSINRLGGELRSELTVGRRLEARTEFYQPIEKTQTFFVAAGAGLGRRPLRVFDSRTGMLQTEYNYRGIRGHFDVGATLWNWGELRLGYERTHGSNSVMFTTTGETGGDVDDGLIVAQLQIDTLDNVSFPEHGSLAAVEWLGAWEALGSDSEWQSLGISANRFQTFGRTTFGVGAAFGTTLSGVLPPHRQQFLGGFLFLSGLRTKELSGQHAALFQLIGYHRVSGSPTELLGMPFYVGASLESGNAWQLRDNIFTDMILAGSAFVGTDTPLGPVYFGYGIADTGQDSLYLFLGQSLRQ